MAAIQALEARALCPDGYYYSGSKCYRDSAWYWWGRWVLAGAVVLFVVLLFFLFTCISARRRRKRGLHPMYGTGWMAPAGKFGHHQGDNQHQGWGGGGGYYGQQQAPPQYGANNNYQYGPQAGGGLNPQHTGTTFQSADGYYGGHHEGVQLQSPPNTYQNVYSPPMGPPPGK